MWSGSGPPSWTCALPISHCSSWRNGVLSPCVRTGRSRPSRSVVSPLAQLLEAALFAAARPLPVEELLTLDRDAGAAAVNAALIEIRDSYAAGNHEIGRAS